MKKMELEYTFSNDYEDYDFTYKVVSSDDDIAEFLCPEIPKDLQGETKYLWGRGATEAIKMMLEKFPDVREEVEDSDEFYDYMHCEYEDAAKEKFLSKHPEFFDVDYEDEDYL